MNFVENQSSTLLCCLNFRNALNCSILGLFLLRPIVRPLPAAFSSRTSFTLRRIEIDNGLNLFSFVTELPKWRKPIICIYNSNPIRTSTFGSNLCRMKFNKQKIKHGKTTIKFSFDSKLTLSTDFQFSVLIIRVSLCFYI